MVDGEGGGERATLTHRGDNRRASLSPCLPLTPIPVSSRPATAITPSQLRPSPRPRCRRRCPQPCCYEPAPSTPAMHKETLHKKSGPVRPSPPVPARPHQLSVVRFSWSRRLRAAVELHDNERRREPPPVSGTVHRRPAPARRRASVDRQ